MGRNTLHIYCLHGLALTFVRKVLNLYVIKEEDSLRVMGIDIVLSVCTFLLCFVVIWGAKYIGNIILSKVKEK